MNRKCNNCGAENAIPNETNLCIYCGSQVSKVASIDKEIIDSNLTLALIEFKDDKFDDCIKKLNKIISKDSQNKSALIYKSICILNLEFNIKDFLIRLKNSELTNIDDHIYNDLYCALKKLILPIEKSYWNYDNEITYFNELIFLLDNQKPTFKTKVLNLFIEVYSWEQHKEPHKILEEDGKWHYGLGYRPQMIMEVENMIVHFKNNEIEKDYIKKIINTIKELYLQTIKYYWVTTNQSLIDYKANMVPFKEDQLLYNIELYKEIQNTDSLLDFINKCQLKHPSIDLELDKFKNEIIEIDINFRSIENITYEDKKKCFIATAVMGDYNHPIVLDLRMFRDNWLINRDWGVQFIKWYYTNGPIGARIIEKSFMLRKLTYIFIIKPLQIITKKLKLK